MLHRRNGGYLNLVASERAPEPSRQLEAAGYTVLRGAFSSAEIEAMHKAVSEIYATSGIDHRGPHMSDEEQDEYRYACFNRSARVQDAIAAPVILDVIEPLLGGDCHVIANTCWRNRAGVESQQGGGNWHIDGGPHVPHDSDIRWDDRIPYPVFAIGVHILLQDCPMACGPTAVIPGSHKSGQPPPRDATNSMDLTCYDQKLVQLDGKAGDVALFVSDVWHRRLPPTAEDLGRFFIQIHYGRRDIAQRILPTADVNHLSAEAIGRAETQRQKTIIGLHNKGFYDG